MSSPILKFIAAAVSDIGVQEEPRGSNKGPEVTAYLALTGLPGGSPWCASFVASCGVQVLGTNWPLPRTASCDVLLSYARRREILHSKPRPGDVFLVMASPNDAIHTGVVERVNGDGTITSVEGNSNAGGSREGYAVVRNPGRYIARAGRLPLQFIRWVDLLDDAENLWMVRKAGDNAMFAKAEIINGRPCLPARAVLTKVLGSGRVAGRLAYDAQDNALVWDGKVVPAQVILRDGTAWAAVRPLLESAGCTVEADSLHRTIIVTPPDA